ncbi:serine protease [Nocardia huaxiensis]|uniref:Serine protease n=1 Tax=Nocardia huaxiensis TaxID=2755382 RepID=A0A7D6VB88_9NOCA|nr:serine protease [Nocardia huaxiensis]QLY32272.1 serine protease [Nocardia huaxiensis]
MSGSFAAAPRLNATVARVWSADGVAVGSGFVIDASHIATCAHVVQAAVGELSANARVAVDFPLVAGAPRIVARVGRYVGVGADGRGDIAILEMDEEIVGAVAAPPLWRADRPWGREFRMIGFPAELPDGAWTSGEFRDGQGTGWLQLQGSVGTQPITPGFSGAPVWDVGSAAVVGMAVAADRRRLTRTAFMIPVTEVLGLDPALLPNPYRGLEPFSEHDSRLFYGRDADIDRVVAALRSQSVVAVAGPSGTGKSSLVLAGVVPRMRDAGWRIEYQTADSRWVNPRTPAGEKVLLVADQFEEVVAADAGAARQWLRDWIDRAADPAVRVLFTLRWDALNELFENDLVPVLEEALLALSPLGRDQLRQAIRGPASHAPGVDIDEALVERLVDDIAGEPGGLPLLESVLTEMWDQRTGGLLTVDDYEKVGRAAGSIARRAERVLGEFDAPGAAAARRLLTMLATPRGDDFVRTSVFLRDFPELHTATGRLARERLVVTGRDTDGTDTVELAHQALIDNWPTLRDWLEADRAFLSWQRQTEIARSEWESRDRDEGGLLRGSALSAAEEWMAVRGNDIPAPVRRYVDAASRVRRREVRRWRVVTAVLAVFALVAGSAAVIAYRSSEQRAETLRQRAGVSLAQESLRLAASQPNTALQLAQAAARLAPDDHNVEAALLTQQIRLASAVSIRTDLWRDATLFASDDAGTVVVVGENDGTVTVWPGLLDGRTDPWRLPTENVVALELSKNGSKLVTVGTHGGVRLWNVTERSGPFQLVPDGAAALPDTAVLAKFSFDGARLVLSRDDLRSRLPFSDARRPQSEVGGADSVLLFDTAAATPAELAGFTSARADLIPLRVDSQRPEIWFAEYDGTRGRTLMRDPVGQLVPWTAATAKEIGFAVKDCGDKAGVVLVREAVGVRIHGWEAGCNAADMHGIAGVFDETGRYQLTAISIDNSLFQSLEVTDFTNFGDSGNYLLQTRYQTTGARAYVVRPGPDGPEVFVIGADDLTRYPTGRRIADPGTPGVNGLEFGRDPATMAWSPDIRYVAEFHTSAEPYTLELHQLRPRTNPVASIPVDWSATGIDLTFTADGRYVVVGRDTHELLVYAVPELSFVTRIELPVPAELPDPVNRVSAVDSTSVEGGPSPVSGIPLRDDVIAVLHAGYVTRWHAGSGSEIGAPQQVWQQPEELALVAEYGRAIGNGANPDELTLFVRDRITVWDTVGGRAVRTMTGDGGSPMWSAFKDGDLPFAYVWTVEQRVQVWNTETGEVSVSPVAVPRSEVLELAPNGLLVIGWETGQIQIADRIEGTLVDGTVPFPQLVRRVAMEGTDLHILSADGLMTMNLDRVGMADRLCAVNDRDFTAAELELLPPGADSGRPCR